MGKEKTRNCSIRLDINLILLEACSVRCSHITFYQEKKRVKVYVIGSTLCTFDTLRRIGWSTSTISQPTLASVFFLLSQISEISETSEITRRRLRTPLPVLNIILCLSLSINNISHNQEQYNPIRPYIKYEGLPINKNTTTRKKHDKIPSLCRFD